VVDALRDGYHVTFPVDAVGGMSQLAHSTAIQRLVHAGAVPNTALALVTELFRDWASPVADKARELVKWYLEEIAKTLGRTQKAA
jgi:tRNA A37 threonylcarbamoyladenosine synthetase subunit TsaC/SUA5/YrdC